MGQVLPQPPRQPARQGRHDDLVDVAPPGELGDGSDDVGGLHLAGCGGSERCEPLQAGLETLSGQFATVGQIDHRDRSGLDRRQTRCDRRGDGPGRHHQVDVDRSRTDPFSERLGQFGVADGLVGDDDHDPHGDIIVVP